MVAVDTNVLVRLLARDDPKQVERAEAFVADGAWISILVLAETVWVLQSVFERRPQQIATAIAMLLEHAQLALQDADVVRAAMEAFQTHRGVDFTDCLVLEVARKAGHEPLGTFDRKLARINGAEAL